MHLTSSGEVIFSILSAGLLRLSFDFLVIDVFVEVVEFIGQFFLGSYKEVSY